MTRRQRELGFAPRPVEDALKRAIDWFRANGYGTANSMAILYVASEAVELEPMARLLTGVRKLKWPLAYAYEGVLEGRRLLLAANGAGPKLATRAVEVAIRAITSAELSSSDSTPLSARVFAERSTQAYARLKLWLEARFWTGRTKSATIASRLRGAAGGFGFGGVARSNRDRRRGETRFAGWCRRPGGRNGSSRSRSTG